MITYPNLTFAYKATAGGGRLADVFYDQPGLWTRG